MSRQFNLILAQSGTSNALTALIVIAVGLVVGSIVASITRRIAGAKSRPDALRANAGGVSQLVFSVVLIVALVVALGIVNTEARDQLLNDAALFLPNLISAAIVMIVASILANLIGQALAKSLAHLSSTLQVRVPKLTSALIMVFASIIAANQLGIDTSIVLLALAAVFFTIALSLALLAGLGGREVAAEVAAGRAIRRDLNVGDTVRIGHVEGDIVAIGSTSTQITSSQRITLVPNTEMLEQWVEVVQDGRTLGLAEDPDESA